jgi:group I intron endonuclease
MSLGKIKNGEGRTGVVYAIRHSSIGQLYVGSTVDLGVRKAGHLANLRDGCHHSAALQITYNILGERGIIFEILEQVTDLLFLRAREQFWMWRFGGRLLNARHVAAGPIGTVATKATRAKHAARMTGNTYRRGLKMSESAKALISESLKGNGRRKGIKHRPEDKAKISAGLKRAIAEGRRPNQAMSLREFQRAVERGEAVSPCVKRVRNDEMVRMRQNGASFTVIASRFGIDPSGCRKTINGHMRRCGIEVQTRWDRRSAVFEMFQRTEDYHKVATAFGLTLAAAKCLVARHAVALNDGGVWDVYCR